LGFLFEGIYKFLDLFFKELLTEHHRLGLLLLFLHQDGPFYEALDLGLDRVGVGNTQTSKIFSIFLCFFFVWVVVARLVWMLACEMGDGVDVVLVEVVDGEASFLEELIWGRLAVNSFPLHFDPDGVR
jgi:hypothetical protein